MLIICTQDDDIRDTRRTHAAKEWGLRFKLTRGSVQQANIELEQHIASLGSTEDLCLSAHGNDEEIGDAEGSWSWDYDKIAEMIADNKPDYRGSILVSACANTVCSFSARLAVALETKGVATGSWVFGYNSATPSQMDYPAPRDLHSSRAIKDFADMQCTRVGGGRSMRSRG